MSWHKLHLLSLPCKTWEEVKLVIRTVIRELPCQHCKAHTETFLNKIKNNTGPVADAFAVSWQLHDEVNFILGKQSLPLEKARAFYVQADAEATARALQPASTANWVLKAGLSFLGLALAPRAAAGAGGGGGGGCGCH